MNHLQLFVGFEVLFSVNPQVVCKASVAFWWDDELLFALCTSVTGQVLALVPGRQSKTNTIDVTISMEESQQDGFRESPRLLQEEHFITFNYSTNYLSQTKFCNAVYIIGDTV